MKREIMPESYLPLDLPAGTSSAFIRLDDLCFHYLHAGSPDNPWIVLLHGFPELAYSWRRNILPLADAGYYVVAPDLRGFGRTTGWDDSYDTPLYPFSTFGMTGDIIRLVTALGCESVRLIAGHDAGAQIAAACALLRPDIFHSVITMSTPFTGAPRREAGKVAPIKPLAQDETIRALADLPVPRKHYTLYYSSGTANEDLLNAPDGLENWFRGYFFAKSAQWEGNHPAPLSGWIPTEFEKIPTYYIMKKDRNMAETVREYMDSANEKSFPCGWLEQDDLHVYAEEYKRSGFQGGLNGYRCSTNGLNAREMALLAGRKIEVPFLYISGEKDWGTWQFPGAFETMKKDASAEFRGTVIIQQAGHWVQQEQPETVNRVILDFLADL